MPGDADAATDFALTPPEEQLLALIRAGRVDAEIAVRLAISNAEVKERVGRLAETMGARDRVALRDGRVRRPSPPESPGATPHSASEPSGPRWWPVAALVVGLIVGGVAGWYATDGKSEPSAAPQASFVDPLVVISTPRPAAPETASPVPTVRATTIGGRLMLDAGQIFQQSGHAIAVASAESRESLAVVTFTDASTFVFDAGDANWAFSPASPNAKFQPEFVGSLGGTGYTLRFAPANADTQFLPGDANSLGIYSQAKSPPVVVLWVDGHHAEVGTDDHLYIDPAPAAGRAAIAFDTGEMIDTLGSAVLGQFAGAWTLCAGELAACEVIARPSSGPEYVPVDGTLVCRADGVLELATEPFRLEFNRLSSGGPELHSCEGFSTTAIPVSAGGILSNGGIHYLIRAVALDGTPLSVVVAGDGTLYVGRFPRKFGCPCRTGN